MRKGKRRLIAFVRMLCKALPGRGSWPLNYKHLCLNVENTEPQSGEINYSELIHSSLMLINFSIQFRDAKMIKTHHLDL